jgi:predicted nuclease of predicted toxin-antitoxin system
VLIFDNNLPVSLCRVLAASFPGCTHVLAIGLDALSDHHIWEHAKERGLVIVSRDGDYEHISALRGMPPKVVRLAVGNQSAKSFAELLIRMTARIQAFIANEYDAMLIIQGETTFTISGQSEKPAADVSRPPDQRPI